MKASTQRLRASVLFEYPTLNGGEYSFFSMVPSLREAGVELTAWAPPAGDVADRCEELGIPLQPFGMCGSDRRRLPLPQLRQRLADGLRQLQPDLVHANSLSMSRLLGPLSQSGAWKSLGHLRDIINLSRQAVDDLNGCDRVLAVSQATADWHVAVGLDPLRTFVQYNGVDLERFQPQAGTGDVQRELGLATDTRLVLSIGQLGIRKGTDLVLQSAAEVATEFPNVHWVLIGERHSQKAEAVEFEAQLHHWAEMPQLSGRVHFLGRRHDVPRIMNDGAMLVHAPRQEPLGRVLLEAAAAGLPIVAARVGGTMEIFPHSQAICVSRDSVRELAAALRSLLSDEIRCQRLGRAARERATACFDVVKRGRQLAEHYCATAGVA